MIKSLKLTIAAVGILAVGTTALFSSTFSRTGGIERVDFGVTRASVTPVYDGNAKRLVDRRIKPGVKYWYEVAVFDQAGNRAAQTIGLRPVAGRGGGRRAGRRWRRARGPRPTRCG